MKRNQLDITIYNIVLNNDQTDNNPPEVQTYQPEEAGLTNQNIEKLRNTTYYRSAAYLDALKNIH